MVLDIIEFMKEAAAIGFGYTGMPAFLPSCLSILERAVALDKNLPRGF
jgi:hypothetical protein